MTTISTTYFLLLGAVAATFGQAASFSKCDINQDGTTTVADVQSIINEALGVAPATNDLNGNGVVNVVDVQFVINAALGLGCAADTSQPPTITDFNPKSAPVGTLITVTGTNLLPNAGTAAQFALSAQGGGMVTGFASTASATSLSFVIPAGAVSGPLSISVNGNSATAVAALAVTSSSSFTLSALPGSLNLIQGQSAAYAISLSSTNGFNQLATVSLTGLPSGVTAVFQPQQITAGETAVVTLTAPAGQATATSPLTVTASATVSGLPVIQTATVMLNVQPVTTALLGRTVVANSPETPLAGVTIKTLGLDGNGNTTGCTGFSTTSDPAGNFALLNLPMQCTGPQLIGYDGTTATAPPGIYAGVNLVYTFVSGQVTPAPVLIHLPQINTAETFYVQQNAAADQSYAYQTIPHLSVTVYAGTTLTMPDGTQPNPFPLAAISVPADRLPDIKPPVPTMITAFIVAFQPANATANQPVAVYYPNPLNTPPGTDMTLLTLDPTHGAMVPYGTGAVSADGTQIVPDLDPAYPGHRYGLVHFDWHMPGYPPPSQTNPCCIPPIGRSKQPIDFSSGLEVIQETDISFGGTRGTIAFQRIYRSGAFDLGTSSGVPGSLGPFGYGTNHNFGYALATTNPSTASVMNLIMPDGNQFPFSKQPTGSFINSGIPSMQGAVMTVEPDGTTVDLRWKDGTIFTFVKIFIVPYIQELLSSITDPNGNIIQILRNGFGITDIIDPVGRDLHFDLNGEGLITQITAPDGRTVSYSYDDGSGPLRVVTHPDGTTTRYDYNGSEDLTAETDGRGVVIASNTYDSNRRVISQTEANGGVLQFAYSLQNPTAPLTSPVMSTTVTDALGHQTVYRFSPAQALLSVTDALGRLLTFGRDGANDVTSITGAASCSACGDSTAGNRTFSYDSFGNLLSQTDALGNTTSFTYDPTFNKVTSVRDPLGNPTTFTYDSHGNLLTQTDANHNTTSYQHDSFGELTAATDPLNQTSVFTYDTLGNLVSIQDPLGHITTLQYDFNGRLLLTQDALGRPTTLTYDNMNRITSQTNAQSGITRFAYDQVGNLLSVTDPRSSVTSFTYDAMNGLLARKDPLGRTDSRTYDLDENLVGFQDRRGQLSSFSYDIVNRLTGETYSDATAARSYDANDRLTSVNDSAGGLFTFGYDAAGRLTGSQTPVGAIQYTRDALGRAASRQVAGQSAVTYSYDPAGNLAGAAMPQAAATFGYDARNELSTINRMNGVSSAFTYDPAARLLGITHAKGASLIDAENYAYDAVGNRASHSTSIGQSLITPAVATASYDADNEQTQFGATSNSFDGNGDSTSTASSSAISTYTWDSRGRLKSIATSIGQTTNFTYDFAGNLFQQIDSGPSLNLTQTLVLDDFTNVVYVNRSDGDQLSVLTGQSLDNHLAVAHGSGQIEYGLVDGVNSTMATVDQTGSLKGKFLYEPFGQTKAIGSTYQFQFTGRVPVSNNLYYNRARFYNSQTGRFIGEDPIGFAGGPNQYSYVHNNPTGFTDPLGLFNTEEVLKGLGGIAGGLDLIVKGIALAPTAETVVGGLASAALISTGTVGAGFGLAQVVGGAFDQEAPGSTREALIQALNGGQTASDVNTLVDLLLALNPEGILANVSAFIGSGTTIYDLINRLRARRNCQ